MFKKKNAQKTPINPKKTHWVGFLKKNPGFCQPWLYLWTCAECALKTPWTIWEKYLRNTKQKLRESSHPLHSLTRLNHIFLSINFKFLNHIFLSINFKFYKAIGTLTRARAYWPIGLWRHVQNWQTRAKNNISK